MNDRVPKWLSRCRHEFDLGYSIGLGAAACALVLLVGVLPVLLPARLLCPPAGDCILRHWTVLDHLFVWDSGWYNQVATAGYAWSADVHGPQDVAFLPLWPLVVRLLHGLVPGQVPFQAATVLLTTAIAVAAIAVFHVLARRLLDPRSARRATLLYVTFPGLHFMLQSYPVGLLNLLCGLSLIAVLQRRLVLAAIWSGIATAAGPIAVSISAVVGLAALIEAWPGLRAAGAQPGLVMRRAMRLVLVGGLSAGGLLAFMAWQTAAFGTPLAFIHAQESWNGAPALAARLTDWIDYEMVYPDFRLAFQYARRLLAAPDGKATQWAFQIGLNAAGIGVAQLTLAGLLRRAAWPLLLQAWLAIALVIWFLATLREPDCALRLIYIAPGCFIGLAALTRRWPAAAVSIAVISGLVLLVQTFLGGAGYWVV